MGGCYVQIRELILTHDAFRPASESWLSTKFNLARRHRSLGSGCYRDLTSRIIGARLVFLLIQFAAEATPACSRVLFLIFSVLLSLLFKFFPVNDLLVVGKHDLIALIVRGVFSKVVRSRNGRR